MWDIQTQIINPLENSLPAITYSGLFILAASLLILRFFIQKILTFYFSINEVKPHHTSNTLEYSYFYHLSVVMLVMVDVEWNMFDLTIWVCSYIGVGFIRKAIHIVRIEKDLMLNDCSYNNKIIQILSASKLFGLILFLCSFAYFLLIHTLFIETSTGMNSNLLFPTLMLAVDSLFLLLSSHLSQR